MTIGSISPAENKGRRRNKEILDEQAPLLPTKHEGNRGFDEFNGASFSGAVFNLSTTIVGAGIMALPATMKVVGLVPGIVMIIFFAFLTEASIEMLIRFSRAGKTISYGGVMGDAFGKVGKVLLQICVIINNVGVLIVYMIIIVHTIDNELDDSSQIKPIVWTSLVLCSTVYIATSFFGFLLFGESILDDVLANFDSNLGIPYSSLLNDAVRVSYAIHLMLVFPIIFHALRLNLDGLLFPSARPFSSDNRRFAVITVGLLSVIFLAANFIPSIWDAFQFTGATAAVCIGFIFPAAITLRDRHGIATKWDKILSVFMIVLAVLSNAIAIYSDAYSLFKKGKA